MCLNFAGNDQNYYPLTYVWYEKLGILKIINKKEFWLSEIIQPWFLIQIIDKVRILAPVFLIINIIPEYEFEHKEVEPSPIRSSHLVSKYAMQIFQLFQLREIWGFRNIFLYLFSFSYDKMVRNTDILLPWSLYDHVDISNFIWQRAATIGSVTYATIGSVTYWSNNELFWFEYWTIEYTFIGMNIMILAVTRGKSTVKSLTSMIPF